MQQICVSIGTYSEHICVDNIATASEVVLQALPGGVRAEAMDKQPPPHQCYTSRGWGPTKACSSFCPRWGASVSSVGACELKVLSVLSQEDLTAIQLQSAIILMWVLQIPKV